MAAASLEVTKQHSADDAGTADAKAPGKRKVMYVKHKMKNEDQLSQSLPVGRDHVHPSNKKKVLLARKIRNNDALEQGTQSYADMTGEETTIPASVVTGFWAPRRDSEGCILNRSVLGNPAEYEKMKSGTADVTAVAPPRSAVSHVPSAVAAEPSQERVPSVHPLESIAISSPPISATQRTAASEALPPPPPREDTIIHLATELERLESVKEEEAAEKEKALRSMLIHERTSALRQENVLKRWEQQQKIWDRYKHNMSTKLGKEESKLVFSRSEEYRERREEAELLEKATPAVELHGGDCWQMTLRDNWTKYVRIGNIFSGLYCPIKVRPTIEKAKQEYIRHPKVLDPSTKRLGATQQSTSSQHARTWKDSDILRAKQKRLEKNIRLLRPHEPEFEELGVVGLGEEGRLKATLTTLKAEGFAETNAKKQAQASSPVGAEEDAHMDSERSQLAAGADAFGSAPLPGPHLELTATCMCLRTLVGKSTSSGIRLYNTGDIAVFYAWARENEDKSYLPRTALSRRLSMRRMDRSSKEVAAGPRRRGSVASGVRRASIVSVDSNASAGTRRPPPSHTSMSMLSQGGRTSQANMERRGSTLSVMSMMSMASNASAANSKAGGPAVSQKNAGIPPEVVGAEREDVFSFSLTRGVIYPGESCDFVFSFHPTVAGVYSEKWKLSTSPEVVFTGCGGLQASVAPENSAEAHSEHAGSGVGTVASEPMGVTQPVVTLRGVAMADDEGQVKREGLAMMLDAHIAETTAAEIVAEIVSGVRTPPRVVTPEVFYPHLAVSAREIAFNAANRDERVYFDLRLFRKLRGVYEDAAEVLMSKAAQGAMPPVVPWDQTAGSIESVRKVLSELEAVDGDLHEELSDRFQALLTQYSTPYSLTYAFRQVCYDVLSSLSDKVQAAGVQASQECQYEPEWTFPTIVLDINSVTSSDAASEGSGRSDPSSAPARSEASGSAKKEDSEARLLDSARSRRSAKSDKDEKDGKKDAKKGKDKKGKDKKGKKEDPEPPPEPEPEEPDEPLEVRRENFYSAMRETIASHVQSALHELAELLVDCEENVEVCAFEVTPEESLLGDENSVADNPSFAEEEGD
eukprot:Rmarinus@m.4309